MTLPIVSVCIPAYNMARYLPFAIESVLNQKFQDYELVICDDASTDSTPEICRSYDDSRIRYVRTAGKSGQGRAFNRCLDEARGEFVTILHHDDYFLPGFLEDRVARLQGSPQFDFVFGSVQVIDADSVLQSTTGRWPDDKVFEPGELLEPMLHGCILCPPSLMIRRSCLEKVGRFRTDLTWGPDWEWNLRLAEHCAGAFTATPYAAYRVHDASGTAEQLNAAKNGPQERRILSETFARIGQSNPELGKLKGPVFRDLSRRHMYFADRAVLEGRRWVARSNLWYAMLADFTMLCRPTFWAMLIGAIGPSAFYRLYRNMRCNPA
jgi:glycosyltransferase involved in cell wall biosynthesis